MSQCDTFESPRHRLPDRRPSTTCRIAAGGIEAHATVGRDPASGAPREIFLRPTGGSRTGSMVDELVDDGAVVISVALQHGVPAEALGLSVSRQFDTDPEGRLVKPGRPATIVGAALELIAAERAAAS